MREDFLERLFQGDGAGMNPALPGEARERGEQPSGLFLLLLEKVGPLLAGGFAGLFQRVKLRSDRREDRFGLL